MTLPDPGEGRKRRRGPGCLIFLVLLAAGLWSGGWFWLKGETEARMDKAAKDAAARGYALAWDKRTVSGFPFRLDVTLEGFRASEPSGWAIRADQLKGEAYVYALDHWVLVAPTGLTFTRPDGGSVVVAGQALRASVTDFDKRPPRIAIEGYKLTFKPAPGAKPYFLSAAETLHLRLVPGPDDQGGFLLRLGKSNMALEGLAARATEGRTVDLDIDLTLTKMSGFQGGDWAGGVQGWNGAGGQILVRKAAITGGDAVLQAKGGTLTVGPDGRLQGDLDASLGDIAGEGPPLQGRVQLRDGQVMLGPLGIGPSPKIY